MTPPSDPRPIALIGLMGAGKSVVARILGERLGARVVDVDSWFEAEEGTSVSEYFSAHGEAAFRLREAELLRRALGSGARVLACGGGAVLDADSRALLAEDCRTVWLEVTPATAAARTFQDGAVRPLLADGATESRLAALLAERAPLYRATASLTVTTDGRTPHEVAEAVLAALGAETCS